MGRPKNWDTMTIEAQDAWRERERIYERDRARLVKVKSEEYNDEWHKANRKKMADEKRKQYNSNPKVIEKRIMRKQIQEDPAKIRERRKLAAEYQRDYYAKNKEKVAVYKNEWNKKNKEKVLKSRSESLHREHLAEMKASGKKVEPAKLDISKVLAFISKKDGPKSPAPITPNMAKVREFIKYA